MTNDGTSPEQVVQRMWDERSIIRTISRLAQAQDDLDSTAYRNCFVDKVLLSSAVIIPGWTGGEIDVDDLAKRSFDNLSRYDATHHMVFNHVIDVQGDEATCVADLNAVTTFIEDGNAQPFTLGGRYFLRLRRSQGEWRIWERSVTARYQYGDKAIIDKASAREPVRRVKSISD